MTLGLSSPSLLYPFAHLEESFQTMVLLVVLGMGTTWYWGSNLASYI